MLFQFYFDIMEFRLDYLLVMIRQNSFFNLVMLGVNQDSLVLNWLDEIRGNIRCFRLFSD